MLNHTRGISSWERARSSAAPLTGHGSHSLLQVIPRTLEPFMELVNPSCTIIYHCGGTKLGQRAPHPRPIAGPMEQPMALTMCPQAGSPQAPPVRVQPLGGQLQTGPNSNHVSIPRERPQLRSPELSALLSASPQSPSPAGHLGAGQGARHGQVGAQRRLHASAAAATARLNGSTEGETCRRSAR